MSARLRIIVADDERPARTFLVSLLRSFDDAVVIGEAASGKEAVTMIEREKPDLALLDLNMRLGEASGAGVATLLLRAAVACHAGMATFAEAGVSAADK